VYGRRVKKIGEDGSCCNKVGAVDFACVDAPAQLDTLLLTVNGT
jgi:hypothetical protein